ncbi:hypothetical protein MA16_Dca017746 [Dendrobium catenatum]|uniref:Uncharacterized protein n=1 Tax=Dendrobium catenatum TaxID=906689 RepID=A0A2I0W6R1_9ASPA|nr:hypothetical protein MA16_Dca017746 [Dendrobium catenatum]
MLGGGPAELRPLSSGPTVLRRQAVVRQRRGPQVVVRPSNNVRRWSGGAQALNWWSSGTPALGCGSAKERASSGSPVEQRR